MHHFIIGVLTLRHILFRLVLSFTFLQLLQCSAAFISWILTLKLLVYVKDLQKDSLTLLNSTVISNYINVSDQVQPIAFLITSGILILALLLIFMLNIVFLCKYVKLKKSNYFKMNANTNEKILASVLITQSVIISTPQIMMLFIWGFFDYAGYGHTCKGRIQYNFVKDIGDLFIILAPSCNLFLFCVMNKRFRIYVFKMCKRFCFKIIYKDLYSVSKWYWLLHNNTMDNNTIKITWINWSALNATVYKCSWDETLHSS